MNQCHLLGHPFDPIHIIQNLKFRYILKSPAGSQIYTSSSDKVFYGSIPTSHFLTVVNRIDFPPVKIIEVAIIKRAQEIT